MKKTSLICTLSLMAAMTTFPLMAEEKSDHQGHHPSQVEAEKATPAPSETTTKSHKEQMEGKMAKMSVRMNKMKQELAQAEEKMNALKTMMEKAQQTPNEKERHQLLAEHGTGLREMIAGFRAQAEKMMSMMASKTNPEGMKDHGKMAEGAQMGGMMEDEMMSDMATRHELMEKRMLLLFDLLDQMMAHMNNQK